MKTVRSREWPKLLVVEDDPHLQGVFYQWFRSSCQKVLVAHSSLEATNRMVEEPDIVLIDAWLGAESGIVLANRLKHKYPLASICLMTGSLDLTGCEVAEGVKCLGRADQLVEDVLAFWREEASSHEAPKEAGQAMEYLDWRDYLEVLSSWRRPDGLQTVIKARLVRDKRCYFSWVIYRHPAHPMRQDIGVAVMRGCESNCLMCFSGKVETNVTKLTAEEMIAQVLCSLDQFVPPSRERSLSANFTCGGDFIFNAAEVCRAIEWLNERRLVPIYVVTTIGDQEILAEWLDRFINLPVTFYWSVHTLDEAKRAWLMPATQGQSLLAQRELFADFYRKTGRRTTLCWMLVKGWNDSPKDIERLAEFCRDQPLDIKVMVLAKGTWPERGHVYATDQDGVNFAGKVAELGIPNVRFRTNLGAEDAFGGSCGTTVPIDFFDLPLKTGEGEG